MRYRRRRLVAAAAVLAAVLLIAGAMSAWGLDLRESAAITLGGLVIAAGAFGGLPAGVGAAVLASGFYLSLRLGALFRLEGAARSGIEGRIILWAVLYAVAGVASSLASTAFAPVVSHLENYDEVDPVTGLGNARRFLILTDESAKGSEVARLRRVGDSFTVLTCAVPAASRRVLLLKVRRLVEALPRATDRICHADLGHGFHLFGVVLPATPTPSSPTNWLSTVVDRLQPAFLPSEPEVVTVSPRPLEVRGYEPVGLEALAELRRPFLEAAARDSP